MSFLTLLFLFLPFYFFSYPFISFLTLLFLFLPFYVFSYSFISLLTILFPFLLFYCFSGSCVHFAIDVIKEIVILFENMYEIYGDIQGASNSFKIKAYEQGNSILPFSCTLSRAY